MPVKPTTRFRLSPIGLSVLAGTGLFLLLFLRSVPCVQTTPGTFDRYLLACYSDVQTSFLTLGLGAGASPFDGDALALSPLLALVVFATTRLATVLGAPVSGAATQQAQVDASVTFFALTTVGLFVCFLTLIVATGFFGRRTPGRLSRDPLLIAASPIVLAVGLISWDLFPLALTAVGLALLATRRSVPAALVLAVASCAGTMPIGISLAVFVAVGLRAGRYPAAKFGAAWVAGFLAIHLPLVYTDFGRLWGYYRGQAGAEPGFGSLWYLAKLWGFDQPHAGSVGFAVLAIALGCFFGFLRTTGRRPRVGSLIAVVVLSTVVLGPAFPPQTGLWVLFAVIVARPFRRELVAVTITQVCYTLAVWGWIDGALTSTQSGPYWLYWLALLARVGVEVWVLAAVLWDVLRPARDKVPTADLVDPIGGELNDHPRFGTAPQPARSDTSGLSLWGRWRRPLAAAAIAVVVTRIAFFIGAYVIQWLMTTEQTKPEFKWDIWMQWDAHHFVTIAQEGYGPEIVGGNAPAFFPLFPMALRALIAVGLEPVHAGLLISAVGTFVASAYLYRLAELHGFDGERSVVYLMLFPTAVFLVAPYTEALFLAGAIPAFYYGLKGRPWPAALFTAVAVGTRTVGLFVLLGVAIELARRAWPSWRKMASAVAAMVVASLPFWAYGLYLAKVRGSFWTFMDVQRTGWGRDFTGFTDGFLATWNTWQGDYSANQIFTWRLEVVFAALSLVLLVWLMWRGYLGYSIYVGATLLIGLSNAWYYSTPRLALAFFPFAFMVAAFVGKRERAHTYTVLTMTVFATVGLVAYTRGAWFF